MRTGYQPEYLPVVRESDENFIHTAIISAHKSYYLINIYSEDDLKMEGLEIGVEEFRLNNRCFPKRVEQLLEGPHPFKISLVAEFDVDPTKVKREDNIP